MALSTADLLAAVPLQIEGKKTFRVRRPFEYLLVARRSSRVVVSRPPMLIHAGASEFVVLRMSFVVSGAVNQMHDVEDLAVRRGGQQLGLFLEVVWGSASGVAASASRKLQLFTFDATGAPECSCSRRSPRDAAALAARISSTGRDEGLILAARPFTKRLGNVPASPATCSGNVEAMMIEFPSSPIGASPCEYSLKRRS